MTLEVDNDPQKLNLEVGDGLNNNLVFDSTNWDSYQRVVIQTVDNQIDTNEDEGFVISNGDLPCDPSKPLHRSSNPNLSDHQDQRKQI